MADFPYALKVTIIKDFLPHVQSGGIPDKVTQRWLPSIGFKSSSDRPLIPILVF